MDVVRITELQPKTYVEQGDYIAIDNQSDGTKKVQFTNLLDDTLSQENKIAPANVVGDEIATIRAAVGSPLKASTVAQMTDTNKIYVYVGSEYGYINGNWYYWNGSAWTSGGVYNSVAVVTDPTLTLSGVPADAKATGDEIGDLKSEIESFKDGAFDQNIFNSAELLYENAYATIVNGHIYGSPSSTYEAYLMEVEPNKTYTCSESLRFTVYLEEDKYTAIGSLAENTTSINTSGLSNVKYIAISATPATFSNLIISIGTEPVEGWYPPEWANDNFAKKQTVVEKDGVKQVTTTNIKDIEAISGTTLSRNIFSTAVLYGEGKYITLFNGKAVLSNNANYDTYYIQVESGKSYKFTNYRYAVVTLADKLTVVGSLYENNADIDTTGGAYIIFSFAPSLYPTDSFEVNLVLQNYELPVNWKIPEETQPKTEKRIYGKGFISVKDDLSDGESLTIVGTNAKKNNIYSFNAHVTSFGSVLIGHGKNAYSGSWIEITGTNLIVHNYGSSDSTETMAHGLTITSYLYVQIIVGSSNKASITIFSNGSSYSVDNIYWNGDANGNTFAESVGSTLTDVVFTWSCSDFRKSVWVFGDSYLSMNDANRWAYYLVQNGYADNVLLNAYGGESSLQATTSLNNMINNYGIPKFIVWCMGMNDLGDTDENTPSTLWINGINNLLSVCEVNDIIPILATIPTVPNISHIGKCKWVRDSGYRYIDFAKAVGAQSDGTWYTGMLSTDNVHPLALGAKALYYQAIADCPELTFENP